MANFVIKQDDTWPPMGDALDPVVLSDKNGPINLAGATVKFFAKHESGTPTITGNCTILSAAAGTIQYEWRSDGTDTATAGDYTFEFQITFGDGRKATAPTEGYKILKITADIGD